MRYQAVIFDMDGTILNTLDDLRVAISYAMGACGHRADWTNEEVRLFFGSGIDVAVRRALACEAGTGVSGAGESNVSESRRALTEQEVLAIGENTDGAEYGVTDAAVAQIKEIYMPYYAAHCNDLTGPYAGITETILALRAAGIKTAVVSNKPDMAVQTLVHDVFPGLFDVAIGELPDMVRKPAPDMTVKALHGLGVSVREAVYVGDTEIDMQTAENADLPCISVSWGFRSREFLVAHAADPIIDRAEELQALVL